MTADTPSERTRRIWRLRREGKLPMPKYPSRLSDEHRKAISLGTIRRYEDPAEREKTGEAAQRYWDGNEEAKAQQSATTAANWRRPGYRENVADKLRGRMLSKPRIDEVGGSVYIAVNNSSPWPAHKVGSVMDGREERREWELRQGYRDWAKEGDDVVFLELFHCRLFRRVEARAHELLGLDEEYLRDYGEITTEPFHVIREKIIQARIDVDGKAA